VRQLTIERQYSPHITLLLSSGSHRRPAKVIPAIPGPGRTTPAPPAPTGAPAPSAPPPVVHEITGACGGVARLRAVVTVTVSCPVTRQRLWGGARARDDVRVEIVRRRYIGVAVGVLGLADERADVV
jgi:hypothetical protein